VTIKTNRNPISKRFPVLKRRLIKKRVRCKGWKSCATVPLSGMVCETLSSTVWADVLLRKRGILFLEAKAKIIHNIGKKTLLKGKKYTFDSTLQIIT
jgi:hypothetical protein